MGLRLRHRSSSGFSLGNLGDIFNNIDLGTLASVVSQFAPMAASQGGSPFGNLGNLGNLGNIASLMSQFTSPQGPINQSMYNQGSRRSSRSNSNSNSSSSSSNNRSNSFGDFDIETFGNILSQMGFGNGLNLNNNYSSESSVDDFVDASPRESYEAGEDVIDMLRMLKRFLTEDRGKVIDAMITLYEENSK